MQIVLKHVLLTGGPLKNDFRVHTMFAIIGIALISIFYLSKTIATYDRLSFHTCIILSSHSYCVAIFLDSYLHFIVNFRINIL